MPLYPASPIPAFPFDFTEEGKTISIEFESGKSQHLQLRRFPRKTAQLNYQALVKSERDVIFDFWRNYWKNFEHFYFYDFFLRHWTDEYVGRGDGATAAFDLHSKSTASLTLKIYVAGVLKTVTAHYNFISGGGAEGADRIQFTAGNVPAAGQLITSDFDGYLRIKAEYHDDSFRESVFSAGLWNIQVALYEVQW